MIIDLETVITALLSALIGTYFGAYFLSRRTESKMKKVRKIASRGLIIFKTYAKHGGTYDLATQEFNAKLNIAEKRTVIVALHKIGIPIMPPLSGNFDVKSISFLPLIIDRDLIDDAMVQISSGQCDHLFFEDPDKYFNENLRTSALRNIAKNFVENVFAQSTFNEKEQKIIYPQEAWDGISWGEKKAVAVFRNQINVDMYFKSDGHTDSVKITKLLSEIDLGVWDIYLNWTYESYNNLTQATDLNSKFMLLSQNALANMNSK